MPLPAACRGGGQPARCSAKRIAGKFWFGRRKGDKRQGRRTKLLVFARDVIQLYKYMRMYLWGTARVNYLGIMVLRKRVLRMRGLRIMDFQWGI